MRGAGAAVIGALGAAVVLALAGPAASGAAAGDAVVSGAAADAGRPRATSPISNRRSGTPTRISPVDNFVLVYAWNEWGEGGTIEPDAEYGGRYLDILKQQLSLPGGGCVANPSS